MSQNLNLETVSELLNGVPSPALVVLADGQISICNTAARQAFRIDRVPLDLTSVVRTPSVLQAVRHCLDQHSSIEVTADNYGAVQRSYRVLVSSIGKDEPKPSGAVLHFEDVTKELRVEQMRSEFVANVSHELRTPLTSISGLIETILGDPSMQTEQVSEFLILMRTQAERMRRLITDLLSLSRIETMEHVHPTEACDLGDTARSAVDLLSTQITAAGAAVSVGLTGPLPVLGAPGELIQVFVNLIENAIKYAAPQAKVAIKGEVVGAFAAVEVSDNGPGVAAYHVPRLTERFYRVPAMSGPPCDGTGLGLAICKHVLNRHRGSLRIESVVGAGSRFTVSVPLRT